MTNPSKAVEIWRKHAKEKYGLDLYLILCQQNSRVSPNEFGYDAALEGAPNFAAASTTIEKNKRPKLLDKKTKITMYSYKKNIFQYILRKEKSYKLFKCIYANFDNTARRGANGSWMFYGSTPELFKKFFAEIVSYTDKLFDKKDEKLLFINAWNEWAEGAHLEPDKKYGYTYLNICKEVKEATKEQIANMKFSQEEKEEMKAELFIPQVWTFKLFGLFPMIKYIEKFLCFQ